MRPTSLGALALPFWREVLRQRDDQGKDSHLERAMPSMMGPQSEPESRERPGSSHCGNPGILLPPFLPALFLPSIFPLFNLLQYFSSSFLFLLLCPLLLLIVTISPPPSYTFHFFISSLPHFPPSPSSLLPSFLPIFTPSSSFTTFLLIFPFFLLISSPVPSPPFYVYYIFLFLFPGLFPLFVFFLLFICLFVSLCFFSLLPHFPFRVQAWQQVTWGLAND